MPELIPVDHDPFASASQAAGSPPATLVPVDHDPFSGGGAPSFARSARDVAIQVPTGFNETLATAVGAPVDAMTWLLNRIPGVEIKQPFAGSESIKSGLELIGANPDKQPATTPAQRIARGAGSGVAAIMVPETALASAGRAGLELAPTAANLLKGMFGGAESAGSVATNAAIGATSGAGGATAAELVPEPYKPLAELGGGLVGGAAGIGTIAAGRAVPAAARVTRDYVAPLTEGGQERLAAETLRDRASDPASAAAALRDRPAELVSGSNPTTFQLTGDMGLGSLERDVATKNPADFNQRRAEQNLARNSALASMQETGSAADVSNFLRTELGAIDASTEEALSRATSHARSNAEAIGGTGTPEAYGEAIRGAVAPRMQAATETARGAVNELGGAGQSETYGNAMRGTLAEARATAKAHERALWNAVDPDGTLSLPINSLKQAGSAIEARMTESAKPITGEERAIFDVINGYEGVAPFSDVTDLRSRISTAMREELRASGETPTYARLTRLRGAVEQAIGNAVEQRASAESQAVAKGEIAPEQTMAAMLSRFAAQRDSFLARRAQDTRTGDGGANGATSAGAASAVPPAPGAPGAGRERLAGDAGGQGLPEAPFQPNFDAAAQDRLRAATAATRERKQTFDSGPTGNVLRSSGMQGQYRLADAAVPAAVFKPGPGGFEAVQAFRRAAGDTAALDVLQDYAAASLRRAAERPDGSLDPARYAAWRRQHQDALRGIPGLGDRFDAAARASEPLNAFRPVSPEVSAAHVPESFFHAGTGGFEDVKQLRQLVGDDHALFTLGDYAASRLRQVAIRPDGTLDPAKFATWRRQHQDALRAFPDLEARFADAARASEAIGEAAATRKSALDAYQQGVFGRLLGVSDAQDVTRVVSGLFGQKNSVQEMKRLADATASDMAARAGLRKAIIDHISTKFISNAEAATSGAGAIKSDAFQNFVKQNAGALRQVFDSDEVKSLQAIAADLRRANRSIVAVKLPGGSNTAQDQASEQMSLMRTILRHSIEASVGAGAGLHFGGPIGSIAGAVGTIAISSMRDAGLRKVDDLIKTAMLDPTVARILLSKAGPKPDSGPGLQLAKYLRRVVGASLFEQLDRSNPESAGSGHRSNPVRMETPLDRDRGSERTQVPSPSQADAGNYQKRHVQWKGLDLAIETEAGQDRTGVGRDGKPWSVTLQHPYGYLKGTVGRDGDQVDAYIGPHPQSQHVFIFDQVSPENGRFDEHKLVLGARDVTEARAIYDHGFSDASGPQRRGAVREMSVAELKQWLDKGDTKKPVAYEPPVASRTRTAQSTFTIRPTLQQLLADKRPAAEVEADLRQGGFLA